MKTKSRHYEAIALRQVLVEKEIAKKQNKKRFNSPWCDESRKKSNQHKIYKICKFPKTDKSYYWFINQIFGKW